MGDGGGMMSGPPWWGRPEWPDYEVMMMICLLRREEMPPILPLLLYSASSPSLASAAWR